MIFRTVDVTNPYAVDVYPPGRITNAQLKQIDLEDITKGIELGFTAPGDDYDSGTGGFVTLRRSMTYETLQLDEFVDTIVRLSKMG